MIEDKDLVAITSFESLADAEAARSHLAAEGIAVVFRDSPPAPFIPPALLAQEEEGGLYLCVPAKDAARAQELLDHMDTWERPFEEEPLGADGP